MIVSFISVLKEHILTYEKLNDIIIIITFVIAIKRVVNTKGC